MATQVNILQNPENFDQMYRLPELQSKRRRSGLPEPRLKGTAQHCRPVLVTAFASIPQALSQPPPGPEAAAYVGGGRSAGCADLLILFHAS
jgi:hypothetical protein